MKKPDNLPDIFGNKDKIISMTLLDYFIAHAPEKPQWDFDVPMITKRPSSNYSEERVLQAEWDDQEKEKRFKIWPSEWARVQLEERTKYF